MRLSLAVFLLSLGATVPSAAAAEDDRVPEIPAGMVEIAREERGNTLVIYVGAPADRDAYAGATKRIEACDAAVAKLRAELDRHRLEVIPDLSAQYEEWAELDREARDELTVAGEELLASALIGAARMRVARKEELSREEAQAIWEAFQKTPLATVDWQVLYRQLAKNAAEVRKWESWGELAEFAERAHLVHGGLAARQRKEYGRALVKVLSLALKDPRATILVSEVEFLGAALFAHGTARVARERVEGLLATSDRELEVVTRLGAKLRELVDERNRLREERRAILKRSARLDPAPKR